ncbi:ATP-binding cassette sub-family A member 5 isoform X2 [Conger conger]|nr:ATP-binding cassette sub-family A member 5 isoform X2 [Conger conger]
MLLLDSALYLLLALYLDQVLPGEFGMRRSLLYFLKPSYWSRRRLRYMEVSSVCERELSRGPSPAGPADPAQPIEPVSPEFRGREAIRISNLRKVYKEKDNTVEALRGLSFDVYEGQITALLGHSGAGKSTLMSILCGICPATEGSASIYGASVSEIADGPEMRQLVGICPQFNIMFDVLTVEEHLHIFSAIKGIPAAEAASQVSKVLRDLDLEKIKDAQARNLSGGQKRKLCVGIAILGDPKVLLLDEPTAGLDCSSRHQVWTLLRSRRAGRVTVLCTHYMDEADLLADRKAVISQGQVKCVGSSLYLKTKCGVGYHLRMSVAEANEVDRITALVKQHIATAQLSRQQEAELTYTLPFESMDMFSGLFSELDCRPDLGISSYGVSMTTLEDVFLRLEAEAEVDQADYSVFNQEQEDEHEASSLDDERLLFLSDGRAVGVAGPALWRQQCGAVTRLHILNLQRERPVIYLLAMFGTFLLSVLTLSLITGNIQFQAPDRQFLPIYLLGANRPPQRHSTALLVQNSSDADISEFLRCVQSQDIVLELQQDPDYMASAPHSAAITVSGASRDVRYQVAFNSTTVHSLPMVLNVLSNSILCHHNSSARIRTWTKPFQFQMTDSMSNALVYIEAVLLGMLAAGTPAYFAMEHTRDREIKCRSTLRVSGLVPSAYWCGRGLVDVPLFYLLLVCMVSTLFAFHTPDLIYPSAIVSTILCVIGSGPAAVLCTYAVSFMFTRVQSNRDFLSVVSMMVCVVSASMVQMAYINGGAVLAQVLHSILCFCSPFYPLIGCLSGISQATFLTPGSEGHRFLWKAQIISVAAPYLQVVLLLLLLRWLEIRSGGRALRSDPLCRIRPRPAGGSRAQLNPEDCGNEDEDVRLERARVKEALTCQSGEEKPAVLVSDLSKVYSGRKEGVAFSKKMKVATNNISFSVRKGEVLGLLGPNGAGKTTIMHMLAGDLDPTSGQVLMGDYGMEHRPGDTPQERLGYCPQTSPLWPRITVLEHLEIYAHVKGLHPQDVPDIIKRVVSALELREHLHKRAKSLSAGIKRKLCFALSMLGNPQIVLLDEPSAGMDPKSKQRMWRAIRSAFKTGQRGAVLTTHYMEEAEAVCDRVAIIVSGRLRCIGSIQHLKGKYGRGYSLEVKLREEGAGLERAEHLHQELLKIFPHAVRQDSFVTLMVYRVPMEDVQCLADSFSQLESAKRTFSFEEYNFSQSTLEQVFLEFAKQQESQEEEAGSLSSSFRWQRLRQDGPAPHSNSPAPHIDSPAPHSDSVVLQL